MANGANAASELPRGIFISYRRDDMGMVVAMLAAELGRYLPGIPVFRDRESIRPGHDWAQTIGAEIESAAVVLVMIGPKWLTIKDDTGRRRLDVPGDQVAREIKEALGSEIRRVIPVLLDGAAPLAAEDLPAAISKLATLHARSLKDDEDFRGHIASFARLLRQEHRDAVQAWRTRERLPAITPVVNDQTSIPAFVAEIKRIREGGSGRLPDPANAMAGLRDFAQLRSIDDLIGLWPAGRGAGGFAELDAAAILTLAAVDRLPEEAAKLAVELRRAEGGKPRLTHSIIHDLAAQRTIPDVAEFIAECQLLDATDLMKATVEAFAGSESRVRLDKALLYFELIRVGREDMARELLAETLVSEGRTPPRAVAADPGAQEPPPVGVIGEVGIVGALRYLSPEQRIVEDWIDRRMAEDSDYWDGTVELVAQLLRNEPKGDEVLARHVARRWRADHLIHLCGILAEAEGSASPSLRLVWRYLAEREHERWSPWEYLAEVISGYKSESPELADTFPELLTAIVTGGAHPEQPCPVDFIRMVAGALKGPSVPARCRLDLLVTAATHPEHRTSGADIAQLLIWVGDEVRRRARQPSRKRGGKQPDDKWAARQLRRGGEQVHEWFDKDLWQAAQQVNRWFAEELAKDRPSFGLNLYTDYLSALRDEPRLTFWAVRELTDPGTPRPSKLTGEQIGAIAVSIYASGLRDAASDLLDTAFELLERYLENEQAVTWQDVRDIVGQVVEAEQAAAQAEEAGGVAARAEEADPEGPVPMGQHPRWRDLLGATIGRWTDTDHLYEVWKKLHENQQEETADARHQGRDYAREADAIMSLLQ
jgi:hypothetical protein